MIWCARKIPSKNYVVGHIKICLVRFGKIYLSYAMNSSTTTSSFFFFFFLSSGVSSSGVPECSFFLLKLITSGVPGGVQKSKLFFLPGFKSKLFFLDYNSFTYCGLLVFYFIKVAVSAFTVLVLSGRVYVLYLTTYQWGNH